MGVVGQLPAPGVQDPEEAGLVSADELRVVGERFDGPGGRREQGVVAEALMAAEEGPEGLGDGKGEHKRGSGQLPLDLFFEPLLGVVVLAAGTVAVAATAKLGVRMTALRTVIDDRALGLGATCDHRRDHLAMLGGHCIPITVEIIWAIGAEKRIENAHLRDPPSRR